MFNEYFFKMAIAFVFGMLAVLIILLGFLLQSQIQCCISYSGFLKALKAIAEGV